MVAVNKIDRVHQWKSKPNKICNLKLAFKDQSKNAITQINEKLDRLILQFAKNGFNASLYYNKNAKEYI